MQISRRKEYLRTVDIFIDVITNVYCRCAIFQCGSYMGNFQMRSENECVVINLGESFWIAQNLIAETI